MDSNTAAGLAGLLAHELANDLQILDDCVARIEEEPALEDADIAADLRYAYEHIERLTTRLRCVHHPEVGRVTTFSLLPRLRDRIAGQLLERACTLTPSDDDTVSADPDMLVDALVELLRGGATNGGKVRMEVASERDETEVHVGFEGADLGAPRLTWARLYAANVAAAHRGSTQWDAASGHLRLRLPARRTT